MNVLLDDTHAPELQSWVASAQAADSDFPLQNLPYARFRRRGRDELLRIGVAIGDQVLDLRLAASAMAWPPELLAVITALAAGELKPLMAASTATRRLMRRTLSQSLRTGSAQQTKLAHCLVPMQDAELHLPCEVGDYTDFYTGIHHATTVGQLFRPDNPLLPNYKWVPIGYHGRASSLCVSGLPVRRPWGQIKGDADTPEFAPTRRLDHELELAAYVGPGNGLGEPVPMANAEDHLFGLSLLNDWSARDLQAWEYQPLGPFLAKNFASTLSPWVVTMEALAPFRESFERPAGDPQPLPYLDSPANREQGALNIQLEVWLQTATMREQGQAATRLMQSNAHDAYWTWAQLLTHHTSNGCNLRTGDVLGSGTLSGPEANQGGSMLELSQGGKTPLVLPNGESRTFLLDGDTVILRGHAKRPGARRIGFGDCAAMVVAAQV
jgi:fumarylacetoacetase